MLNRKVRKAADIFDEYMKLENRIPSKQEFDLEFYGRIMRRNESNHYYNVKRKWLAEQGKEKEGEI